MAGNVQFMYSDTIVAMKKAMARADDASDSDDSLRRTTNRGNKLKRKAKYVQQGRLCQADGPRVYKRPLLYNGYKRQVISRNPRRLDADGDSVDEDEAGSNPDLTDSEDDPYADVKLENILMPLTSAADLDKHPYLSQPYKSKALDEMLRNAQDIVYREQEALWHVKQIMIRFRGDSTFITTGSLQTEQDVFTLQPLPALVSAPASVLSTDEAITLGTNTEWDSASIAKLPTAPDLGDTRPDKLANDEDQLQNNNHESTSNGFTPGLEAGKDTERPVENGGAEEDIQAETRGGEPQDDARDANQDEEMGEGNEDGDEDERPAHRMTTRAKAQAENEPSMSSRAESPADALPLIHPFFIPTAAALPTQPPTNTEVLRLLAAYVQKQEEVVRQSESLLRGLQKAMRLRKTIWSWCRAEGHVGEMSDGEDWYDMEEWGLDEPLKKGNDEEDEEVVTGKPRRNRRNAA